MRHEDQIDTVGTIEAAEKSADPHDSRVGAKPVLDRPIVSIIVVSYNTAELTCAAIDSVYEQTVIPFELLVVDNDSSDGSAELIAERFPESQYPNLHMIRLDENAGFAAANNLAAERASGRYILLLNPDTLVMDNAVDRLVHFAEKNPDYGIYGGSTFFEDMSRNPTAGWNMATPWSLFSTAVGFSSLFRRSRLFNPESLEWWDWSGPREVDIVTGCFFLIPADLWRRLGGFDLDFRMYGEDADICLRAREETGTRPVLYPAAQIIHYGGASESVRADKMMRVLRAKVLLFRKHWSVVGTCYALSMLKLGAWCRTVVLRTLFPLRPSARLSYTSWHSIWKRRLEWVDRCRQ